MARNFAASRTLELDADTLLGRLRWPAGIPGQGHYLLHPAVLDQCFQAVLGWVGAHLETPRELTFLPVAFGRLTFMAEAGPAVELRARLLRFGQRSASVDFELLDAEGRLIARLDTARFRAAALAKHVAPPATWVTRAQLAPLRGDVPALPSGEAFRQALSGLERGGDLAGQVRYFEEIAPLLEMLPLAYARDALRAGYAGLRQRWRSGHPLQRWLLALAQEEGLITDEDDTVILDEDIPPTASIWTAALADCPAVAPELLRIGRVGRQLVQNPDADWAALSSALGAVESDDRIPVYAASNQAVVEALALLLQKWPAGRPVRILDIGAGDDAMLARLRPILPTSDLSYVLARADAEIRAGLALDHTDGDAEVVALDPADFSVTPGPYTPKQFDVVLVHHALHGVAQPARALREIRRYLAQDGVLLLTERYPDRASDFARGIDATWWHGDAKPHGSLLAPQNWTDLLQELGWRELQGVLDQAGSALGLGSLLSLDGPQPRRPSPTHLRRKAGGCSRISPAGGSWPRPRPKRSGRMVSKYRTTPQAVAITG